MTRLSVFIAALFPVDEYVPGLGFISRLPGSLAPRRGKLDQQQSRDVNAERLRTALPAGMVGNHHDNAGAA